MINKLRNIYSRYHINFYASIAGSLIMGTVNLVTTVMHFSWLTLNYCLFSYLLVLTRVLLTFLGRKPGRRALYLAGAISLMVLMFPMTAAMVQTITERGAPSYPFYWMIYVYAAYGTGKFVFAVRSRHRARKSGNAARGVLSWISLVSAAYTLQMMEFALIATFDPEGSGAMVMMQFFTHGAILVFTAFVIVHLFMKYLRQPSFKNPQSESF